MLSSSSNSISNSNSIRNININSRKKALDLFDPNTLDRIRHLKSKKKPILQNSQNNKGGNRINDMYRLDTPQVKQKNIRKKSPKKIPYIPEIIKKKYPDIDNDSTYHGQNNKYQYKQYNNNHNYQQHLTIPQKLTSPKRHHPKLQKPSSPFYNMNLPRRNHSPKTVWRIIRNERKKCISFKNKNVIPKQKSNTKSSDKKSFKNRKPADKKQFKSKKDQPPEKILKQKKTEKSYENNRDSITNGQNVKKKQTKTQHLVLDRSIDVNRRCRQRKTLRKKIKKWDRKKIVFYLARRGFISLETKAPIKLLQDLYLTSRAMGNIYIEKYSSP